MFFEVFNIILIRKHKEIVGKTLFQPSGTLTGNTINLKASQ